MIPLREASAIWAAGQQCTGMYLHGMKVWQHPDAPTGPPTVANVESGGYRGTTATITDTGEITITNTASALSGDLGVTHYFLRAENMLGKMLTVRRSTGQPNNSGSQLGMWQMAWSYDPHGDDWRAFDTVVNSSGMIVASNADPLIRGTVYVARRPVFTSERWRRAIARWRSSPLTEPTVSADAEFVIGQLPANAHAPAMDCHGFRFGSGPVAFALTGNVHTDEHIAAYSYEGLVDWLLSDSADAAWLRDNLTFYCYPALNPQARYVGASRVEVTTGQNANRIFAPTGFDHIPLSKLLRDAWAADLPATIGGHFDFHDTINGTRRGFVFHTNSDGFLTHLQAVYSARTGQSVIVEPSTATDGIAYYLRNRYAPEISLAVEHEISRLVSIPEWLQWGRDFGAALRRHYAAPAPNPNPWQEPVWIPGDANVTVTRDTNGDWLITGTNRNPVAALAIPAGKTIEVQFNGDGGSGSNATYIRQSAVTTLLIAESTDLSPNLAGASISRLVTVTHDPARPYVGIVQSRTGTTRTLRMFASCRWREV